MRSRLLALIVLVALLPFLAGATIVIRGPRVPAGVVAGWVDTVASGSTDSNRMITTNGEHWTDITLTTGNATKIRAYIRDYSYTQNIKLGLYNSGGTLLQSGAVSVTGTGYFEVTITSTAVTAGTYKIHWVGDSSTASSLGSDNGVGNMHYTFSPAGTYTLLSSIPASDGSTTETVAVGVYIE